MTETFVGQSETLREPGVSLRHFFALIFCFNGQLFV